MSTYVENIVDGQDNIIQWRHERHNRRYKSQEHEGGNNTQVAVPYSPEVLEGLAVSIGCKEMVKVRDL